jgi:hypothetical protein
VAVLVGAGLLSLASAPGPLRVHAALPKIRCTPGPSQHCRPTPLALPSPCGILNLDCPPSPSPSPSILVISPVPLDPSSAPTTPSYLIGRPSPSPSAPTDTGGSPVPLGGGAGDLPTPSAGAVSSISDSGNRGDGLPLPLLLLGFVFLVAAAGALIYAVAPRGERFPERTVDPRGVNFTPPGPDTRPGGGR